MVSNREKRYDDLRIIYSVSQNGFWLQSSTSYTLVLTLKVVIQMNYNFGATKLALLVAIHFMLFISLMKSSICVKEFHSSLFRVHLYTLPQPDSTEGTSTNCSKLYINTQIQHQEADNNPEKVSRH